MSEVEMLGAALRAVRCEGWQWMPGMLAWHPYTGCVHVLCDDDGDGWHGRYVAPGSDGCNVMSSIDWSEAGAFPGNYNTPFLPVLTDPATLGCLAALVEQAHGREVQLRCRINHAPDMSGEARKWWRVCDLSGRPLRPGDDHHPTRAEALVAALEMR